MPSPQLYLLDTFIMTKREQRQARALERLKENLPKMRKEYLLRRHHCWLRRKEEAQLGEAAAEQNAKHYAEQYFNALEMLGLEFEGTNTHSVCMLAKDRLATIEDIIENEGSVRFRLPNNHHAIASYEVIDGFSGQIKRWVLIHMEPFDFSLSSGNVGTGIRIAQTNFSQTTYLSTSILELREKMKSLISANWPELLDKIL